MIGLKEWRKEIRDAVIPQSTDARAIWLSVLRQCACFTRFSLWKRDLVLSGQM